MSDDYKGDATSTGRLVIDGAAVNGDLEVVGDADWFAVTLEAGELYEFALAGVGNGALIDPYLYLRDADGELLAGDDDSGPGLDSLLAFTAVDSGSYWLEARGYADRFTGAYELSGVGLGSRFDPVVRTGTAANERLSGRDGNDSLAGAGGADWLSGIGGEDTLDGGEGDDTLDGGTGEDWLQGGAGRDRLSVWTFGIDGNDTLDGGDGDDTLTAGLGDDLLQGGAGSDLLDGREGADRLDGGAGDDYLVWVPGDGADSAEGGSGIDRLSFSTPHGARLVLTDTQLATPGGVTMTLSGVERAHGSADSFSGVGIVIDASGFTQGPVTLTGSLGDDLLVAPSGPGGSSGFSHRLSGFGGNDTLTGGAGIDVVYEARNVAQFVLDNERLVFDGGSSVLSGIEGAVLASSWQPARFDVTAFTGVFTVLVNGRVGNDTLLGGGARDRVDASSYGDLTLSDTALVGSANNQLQHIDDALLRGVNGAFDNVLDASRFSGGLVRFDGRGGNDTLVGRADGTDRVQTRASGDFTLTDTLLTTSNGRATLVDIDEAHLIGQDGANRFDVSAFTGALTLLDGGAGDDTLIGRAAGIDRVTAHGNVDFTLTDTTLSGLGTDSLSAIDEATLVGDGDANTLDASAFTRGTVRLYGESGNDLLTGGSANDQLSGGVGNDTLDGGAGIDRVEGLGDVDFTLTDTRLTGAGTDTLLRIEQGHLIGGPGDNRLDASAFTGSLVILEGRGGDDLLIGRAGGVDRVVARGDIDFVLTDTLLTGLGTDTLVDIDRVQLFGYSGDNVFDASASTRSGLAIRAGAGNDTLLGGHAGDRLEGGHGADRLAGGEGTDTLLGGAGADVFVFAAAGDSAATRGPSDLIQDFSTAGGDRLDLSAIDADTTLAGPQAFLPLSQGAAFSGSFSAPGALFYDTTTATLYANIDADSAADFVIRLPGVASLSDAVFV